MSVLYIVRHGQRQDSSNNVDSPSHPDSRPFDPDITAVGIKQAQETGDCLAKENPDFIYSSPFLRTVRTASEIASKCGLQVGIEWGLAEWFRQDWMQEWPGTIPNDVLRDKFGFPIRDCLQTGNYPVIAESVKAMQLRYVQTAQALANRHKGKSIILVSHGGAIISIPGEIVGWDKLEDRENVGQHRQCGITKMTCTYNRWSVDYMNDVSHLTHVET